MAKRKATFDEIGRIKVSPTTDIAISTVTDPGDPDKAGTPESEPRITGININTHITTPRYTGYTSGVFVPNDKILEFKKLLGEI